MSMSVFNPSLCHLSPVHLHVELLLMATSLQLPLFSVPVVKKSIHCNWFKTSLQRPFSSVPKVAIVERINCSPKSLF